MINKYHYIPRRLYEVTPTGCWEWTGRLNNRGRPAAPILGMTSFRFLCMIANGPPPEEHWHAAHTCDNRKCINPDHSEWQPPEQNNPGKRGIHPETERYEHAGIYFRIKKRVSNKGNNRRVSGMCAAFRLNGRVYRSGAYYSTDAAIRWAKNKIDEINHTA